MQRIANAVRQRMRWTTAAAIGAVIWSCAFEPPTVASTPRPDPAVSRAQLRGIAFVLDLHVASGSVQIVAPISGGAVAHDGSRPSVSDEFLRSLLGAHDVDLSATNYVAGALGALMPNKVLVTFDLTVTNRLVGFRLITPTFPTPPAGVSGIQAFPLEIAVIVNSADGSPVRNEFVLSHPVSGPAVASTHWDGDPHNFLNDDACTSESSDCFRYEGFGAVDPQASSAARQVGFLIDPRVRSLRVQLILAADIQPATGLISHIQNSAGR